MRLLIFSKKSCQERSPIRSFMLNSDPLVGITTAIGDCASTTLLHLWSNNMRHPITEQQRKQLNCCVSLANSEKNFSPVKGDTFVNCCVVFNWIDWCSVIYVSYLSKRDKVCYCCCCILEYIEYPRSPRVVDKFHEIHDFFLTY